MRSLYLLILMLSVVLNACRTKSETNPAKIEFGIHEIAKTNDIPLDVFDTLRATNIQFEKDSLMAVIGYISKSDTPVLKVDLIRDDIKLVRTYFPVDENRSLYAVVAVKSMPYIVNNDIKNSGVAGKNVEIYFNVDGAKKWAEMTSSNTGSKLAFVIDGLIYAMPYINDEIRTGAAVISGLESEALAKRINEGL